MVGRPWSDDENQAIVADYFKMLAEDLAGHRYNKAEHNRRLQSHIGRSKGAIEYKHQNISAVLIGLGETWIPGYRPASNFQASLEQAVLRHLQQNSQYSAAKHARYEIADAITRDQLVLEPVPPLSSSVDPVQYDDLSALAQKWDVAGRDARNRLLGKAGEKLVLGHERARLERAGRQDLAREVQWVSNDLGDGKGYDILSFSHDGGPRLIEVKTTNGWSRTPFYISRNELEVSQRERDSWYLLRVWNFAREPRAFELRPPLDSRVKLCPLTYEARFS